MLGSEYLAHLVHRHPVTCSMALLWAYDSPLVPGRASDWRGVRACSAARGHRWLVLHLVRYEESERGHEVVGTRLAVLGGPVVRDGTALFELDRELGRPSLGCPHAPEQPGEHEG